MAARLRAVADRIVAAGGDLRHVRLVAVTKGFDADVVAATVRAGHLDVGESYAQELLAKADALDDLAGSPRWHFVGRLQRNKVRRIAGLVHLWHSVDRLSLGVELARAAPGATVLLQVNATGEPQKAGCASSHAPGVVEGLRDLGLHVAGLMTIGPQGPPEAARPAFRSLRALADRLSLPECSMGMSDDLEVAVQEGATIVRVGTALFGPRRSPRAVEH